MAIRGRIVNTENGYAITLAEGWIRFDLDSVGVLVRKSLRFDPGIVALCPSSHPVEFDACLDEQVAQLEGDLSIFSETASILAFDLQTLTQDIPTMAIVYTEEGFATPEYLVLSVPAALRAQGVTGKINSEVVNIPAGEAAKFTYRLPISPGVRAPAFHFGLSTLGLVHSVLVIGTRADRGLADKADALMESLELLEST